MRITRAAIVCAAVLAAGVVLVSGGSSGDPSTPPALPGLPPPFLGTTVTGDGGLTAAIDAYGDVVDLRAPGPAGTALIDNPSARQAAGTVPADTGIVPRVRIAGRETLSIWRADSVAQRYLRGTNVVRTVAAFHGGRVVITTATDDDSLAVLIKTTSRRGASLAPEVSIDVADRVRCARERRPGQLHLLCEVGRAVPAVPGAAAEVVRAATKDGRHWIGRSRPLGPEAPAWAQSMYRRSLLVIHALTSRATGAVAAGARDGWAYVWPRDAATAALALEASGHRAEARSVVRFLTGLDLGAAARFTEDGVPVPGRSAQGDASGWVAAAARATGLPTPKRLPWRDRPDYQESSPGTYLGNALAAASATPRPGRRVEEGRQIAREFGTEGGLMREAGDPESGFDSAAGWAVRPFGLRALYPAAERTLLRLARAETPYGITPGEGWDGGEDPWTAPTAWSAWALAGLAAETTAARGRGAAGSALPGFVDDRRGVADRRAALKLLGDLRRASTPAGDLPERVGVHTGIPTSTTPLLWSSAFAVLALREFWP